MWPGRPDGSGRRGAKVGEQTRFYGDTYDWAFQNATVASLLAASVFFPRGLRRKCFAGGGVATDVPQPGGKEISDQLGECTASLRVRELWFRLRRAGLLYCEIDHICEDFQTASWLSLSVSASLAASSAVTTVRSSKCYIG